MSYRSKSTFKSRMSTVGKLLSDSSMLAAHTANIRLSEWEKIAGERLAKKASPERLVDGVLTIRVPSSTWAQEMSMLSEMLVERLKQHRHPVKRLRFRVAPRIEGPKRPVVAVRCLKLPASLREQLARIEDEPLRLALQEAASYSLGRAGEGQPKQGPNATRPPRQ